METRTRSSPKNFFEVFVEVARPAEPTEEPFIIQKFPSDYNDEEVLKVLPKFVFPCVSESVTVDHFTFVLTDIDSKFRFCFCRHATGAQTGLCIVSWLPWFEVFYKLLNYLAELTNRSEGGSVDGLLQAFHRHPVPPEPGQLCDIIAPNFTEKFSFTIPDQNSLPTIPDNRNLTEYYNAVDANNMMIIFASMLYERRILVVSKKLSRLTACVHAGASLLYPMFWQHLYIPVLPPHLLDYCSAPMPYLIGVHSSLFQKVRLSELGDAVILDADKNSVQSQYNDLSTLPSDVVSALKKRLRGQGSEKNLSVMVGDWLARSFLKALVALIGGYRDALRFRPGESICFDAEAFLLSRPAGMRAFLENTLQLQTFEQFINGRLDMLNSGQGFADEFEMENNMMGDKWATKSRYKEWSNSMKKLQKGGKDRLVELTGKVKDKGKKAYSNIRLRLDELRDSPEKSASPSGSPGAVRRGRPQTIPPQNAAVVRDDNTLQRRPTDVPSRQYKILDLEGPSESHSPRVSKRQSSDDSSVDAAYNRLSLDLMQDQDIQAVYKKSYSLEDLTTVSEESNAGSDTENGGQTQELEPERVHRSSTDVRRPVPAPRSSLHRESSVPVLASSHVLPPASTPFTAAVPSHSAASLRTNSSEDSLENIRLGEVGSDDAAHRPRHVVMRKPAFKSHSRPVSLVRDSPVPQAMDALSISEARTAFMQTESIPKSLSSSGNSLEDFDPLVTGQLVVDSKQASSQGPQTGSEENLLKDWTGVDFSKKRPPLPPKPAGYVNNIVSQLNTAYPSTGFPQMGVTSRLPAHSVRPPVIRPLVSQVASSHQSFYSTPPTLNAATKMAAVHTRTQPATTQASSFLHSLSQSYTGPHANLQMPRQGWPPPVNTTASGPAQDPFGEVLQQANTQNPVQTGGMSHNTQNPVQTGVMSHNTQNPVQTGVISHNTQNHERTAVMSNTQTTVISQATSNSNATTKRNWETFD